MRSHGESADEDGIHLPFRQLPDQGPLREQGGTAHFSFLTTPARSSAASSLS